MSLQLTTILTSSEIQWTSLYIINYFTCVENLLLGQKCDMNVNIFSTMLVDGSIDWWDLDPGVVVGGL